LAFKPETDDIREATSVVLIRQLLGDGAEVYVYDPQAMGNVTEMFGSSIEYCNNKYETANETDAVVLVTEWREFRMADWEFLRSIMRGNLIIDGRNIYNQEELTLLGFRCVRIGRK
ncbi:MAG: UDP-glucose/GDP-mannose dehydrogenase family protein, partial [Mucinivorans sp.]